MDYNQNYFVLSGGKCYKKLSSCDLQVGGECYSCRYGFTNVYGICMDYLKADTNYAQPNTNTTAIVPFSPNITWKVVTSVNNVVYYSYQIL